MNRRRLLKHLAALPVVASAAGCKFFHGDKDDRQPQRPGIRNLKVILHGPFAVVLQKDKGYRIKAFLPYDDGFRHEFCYGSPLHDSLKQNKGGNSYYFRLEEDGLDLSGEAPYVDHGFDSFNPEIPNYYEPQEKSFIVVDLPAPHLMSYIPDAQPVLFENFTWATLPKNHVFEYKVKDSSKVKMYSPQVRDFTDFMPAGELKKHYEKHYENLRKRLVADDRDMQPFSDDHVVQLLSSFREIQPFDNYREVQAQIPDRKTQSPNLANDEKQRRDINNMLQKWEESQSGVYFLGAGLPPGITDKEHARRFFNEKLLPIFYGLDKAKYPPDKVLRRITDTLCDGNSNMSSLPMLMPAVYRPDMSRPRLLRVSYTENCASASPTATTTGSSSGSTSSSGN